MSCIYHCYLLFLLLCLHFLVPSVSSDEEVMEIAHEFVQASSVLTLSTPPLAYSSLSGRRLHFSLYLIHNGSCWECTQKVISLWTKEECNPSNAVEKEKTSEECLPFPDKIYLVPAMKYSPPMSVLGRIKSHITALSHSYTAPLSSSRENMEGVLVIDVSEFCISTLPSTGMDLASTLKQLVTSSSHDLAFLLSPPDGNKKLPFAYLTTNFFVSNVLLKKLIVTCNALEYDSSISSDINHMTLQNVWSFLLQENEIIYKQENIFSSIDLKCDSPLPSTPSLSERWEQKNIFVIALTDRYYREVDWARYKEVIMGMNPGYSLHLYTDAEVDSFLREHFPHFVDFYYHGPMKYWQWKSDFIRYLLLYKFGGIYIDIDHKPLLSFDSLLDMLHMECCQNTKDWDNAVKHVFIHSVTPGSIHNAFIMTNTIGDELFLALAGQIFMLGKDDMLDYGLNTRNLFSLLSALFGPLLPQQFGKTEYPKREVFLLQENKLSGFSTPWCQMSAKCKYGIHLNMTISIDGADSLKHTSPRLVMYSNGFPNWPPKHNKGMRLSS